MIPKMTAREFCQFAVQFAHHSFPTIVGMNTERRFSIVSSGPIVRLAPRRKAVAALPEPAWHTCVRGEPDVDWDGWRRLCGELAKVSDARLVEMLAQQQAWRSFNGQMASSGSRYASQPIGGSQIFTLDQLNARSAAGSEVDDALRRQIVSRFQGIVEKRREVARQAAQTRRWKKARTA